MILVHKKVDLFHHRFDVSTFAIIISTAVQNRPQVLDSAMANASRAFRRNYRPDRPGKNFNTGKTALVYSAIAVRRLTPLRKMLNLAIVSRIVVLVRLIAQVAVGTFPLVLE
jgi:hypothetical protein